MPFLSVAIQNALCRSNRKLLTAHLLLSRVGAVNVFQEPFTKCSRPTPWPGFQTPAHTDPSGPRARSDIPANPVFNFSPGNSYEEEAPGFHRTIPVECAIRKNPRLSLISVWVLGGTPSFGA